MSVHSVTITSGASLSSAISFKEKRGFFGSFDSFGNRVSGVITPETSGWTAADLTFAVSVDGVNYYPLYNDDGTEYTITVSAGSTATAHNIDITKLFAWPYVKIRSGTSGTPVNQGGDRVLYVIAHLV